MTTPNSPPSSRRRAAATAAVLALTAATFGGLFVVSRRGLRDEGATALGLVRFRLDHEFESGAAPTAFPPAGDASLPRGAMGPLVAPRREAAEDGDPFAVAGHALAEAPVAGEPKVVALGPSNTDALSTQPTLEVLFDQAVDLTQAQRLIELSHPGELIPVTLSHPAKGSFEDHAVDARWVVQVRPQRPLVGKTGYKLMAKDAKPKTSGEAEQQLTFDVAGPLELRAIECGKDCLLAPSRVLLSSSALVLAFSHRVAASPLPQVVVTPKVKDLQVSVNGRRVTVTGSFAPSSSHRLEVVGLRDTLGQSLAAPVRLTLQRGPLDASIAQPEGLLTLGQGELARLALPTRNVAEVLVSAYPVDVRDPAKLRAAMDAVRSRTLPEGEPAVAKVLTVPARRDASVELPLGLDRLLGSTAHLVTTRITKAAFGATSPTDAGEEDASELLRPTLALVIPASANALAAHVHRMNDRTLVHVARLDSGEVVSGAAVSVSAREAVSGRTDARGVAVLTGDVLDDDVIQVMHEGRTLLVPAHETSTAEGLFPHLSIKLAEAPLEGRRAYLFTERGVYRPGDPVHVKGTVRLPQGGRLAPIAGAHLAAVLLDASHKEMARELLTTTATGGFDLAFGLDQRIGHRTLELRDGDAVLATSDFLVAETETPRFLVDVEAAHMEGDTFVAEVRARYPFGAPLSEGAVHFSLRRTLPGSYFDESASYTFSSKLDERAHRQEIAFTQAGDGKLGEGGAFAVRVKVPKAAITTALELEVDVADPSERHVAANGKALSHVANDYAGLELVSPWGTVGQPFAVRGLVADRAGKTLADQDAMLRLVRLRYHVSTHRAGQGIRTEWSAERVAEPGPHARCAARAGAPCTLIASKPGEYLVVASHGGRDAGEVRVYFAPKAGDGAPLDASATRPVEGRVIDLVADKPSYRAGEVAHVAIRAPFSQGHALVTLDHGAYVSHRTVQLSGPLTVLDVPVDGTLAPWANLTVTAFGPGADYRIGAARLRVRADDAELSVAIVASGDHPAPGSRVPVRIEVRRSQAPVKHAEVTVAVVDEAVHRLGGDQDPAPASWLHPGAPLAFAAADSRDGLGAWLAQSHVAGDGSEGGDAPASLTPPWQRKRKKNATVLYLPTLFTGDDGSLAFDFPAPEQLSEYRITATVIDVDGRAGSARRAVVVDKPIKMVPVVPRFLALGDHAEVGTTVHNDSDRDVAVHVKLGDALVARTVPKHGQDLVRFPVSPSATGPMTLRFALDTPDGRSLDRADATVPVRLPAALERPEVSGTFQRSHTVRLDVPAYAAADAEGELTVQIGENLWPELGSAVDALLDYPHGCLEQTTSSTLPLLAAQIILPRTGTRHVDAAELAKMVEAGVARLWLMRTSDGGLGYWPGDASAHVYGTSYAFLALDRAAKAKVPKAEALRDGVAAFLKARLERSADPPDTLAFMAASLSSAGKLDPARLPALWDSRAAMTSFGRAHLALAALGDRRDQAETLADELEAEVLRGADLAGGGERVQWETFASPSRDAAAVLRVLARLKPSSEANRVPGARVLRSLEGGTTQEAAFGLLALSEIVVAAHAATGDARVFVGGEEIARSRGLGAGIAEFKLPLRRLAGQPTLLRLESSGLSPTAFALRGSYRRPVNVGAAPTASAAASADTGAAWRLARGPNVFRTYTDAHGKPVDLAAVPVGSLVRVAVLAEFSGDGPDALPEHRLRYLAMTDRLPAGFEPVDPDLRTVASVPTLANEHPFAAILKGGGAASHVSLHDDRVQMYFDDQGQRVSAATYVMRATTRGTFVAPPAEAELMYEPHSLGRSEAVTVTVQ